MSRFSFTTAAISEFDGELRVFMLNVSDAVGVQTVIFTSAQAREIAGRLLDLADELDARAVSTDEKPRGSAHDHPAE